MQKVAKTILRISAVIFLIAATLYIYFFELILHMSFLPDLLRHNVLRNETAADVKFLESHFGFVTEWYDIKIQTKDGYEIFLDFENWALRRKSHKIIRINDIDTNIVLSMYEITDVGLIPYEPTSSVILGKMIGKKLKSVSDIIDNRKELYELLKLFESKSRKNSSKPKNEFTYKDRFIITVF